MHWVNRSLTMHPGLIVEVLPEDKWNSFGMPTYKVLSSLGYIKQFTEAALRDFKKSGILNDN